MRIAQIPPLYEAVPPKLYGGTERVVAHLCDALIELGHDVTLFSSADARTKAKLVAIRDQALRLDPEPYTSDVAAHLIMLNEVRRRAHHFDVLHFHLDLQHFPLFEHLAHKTVSSMHGRLDLKDLAGAFAEWPVFPLVSISESQRAPLPQANWVGTVHHGLPTSLYAYREKPDNYLAFLGRISPEKQPDAAIRIAIRAGVPLKMAAKIDAADRAYFEREIRPLLEHPLVEFIGEIADEQKSEFLGRAQALLFPIAWPEPFGLVMIEAMACGTPVIAFNCGSVPEVLDDGCTGYLVASEAEAVAALDRIPALDRYRIRQVFEQRFSATTMAKSYLDIYSRLQFSAVRSLATAG